MTNHRRLIALGIALIIGLTVATGAAYAGEVQKININTATAEQLTQLRGIGSSHAAAIIGYREKNGPFKKPEDLINVPRIGQKTFEKNRALITVQKPQKQQAKK